LFFNNVAVVIDIAKGAGVEKNWYHARTDRDRRPVRYRR
jgi:hypothetical protein